MTAPQPPLPGHAGEPSGDPSMEDILASIRRILSEDEAKAEASTPTSLNAGAAALGAAPAHGGADDVLLLDSSMLVEAPVALAIHPAPAHQEPPAIVPPPVHAQAATPPPPAPASAPVAPIEPIAEPPLPVHPSPTRPETLVAPEAAAAAATSVGALLRHLQVERQTAVHRGGPTIEDIVREEMRPILKQWLDAHLPPLVERLVRAEIERVVARSIP